jgi:hypothetical protein
LVHKLVHAPAGFMKRVHKRLTSRDSAKAERRPPGLASRTTVTIR